MKLANKPLRKISLSWEHPTNVVEKFTIYRDTKPININALPNILGEIIVDDTTKYYEYDDYELSPNTTYFYIIKSVGDISYYSHNLDVTTGDWVLPITTAKWLPESRGIIQSNENTIVSGSYSGWSHIMSTPTKVSKIKQYVEVDITLFGRRYRDSLQIGIAPSINWGGNTGEYGRCQYATNGRSRAGSGYVQFSETYDTGDVLGFCIYLNDVNNNVILDVYKNGKFLGMMYSMPYNENQYIIVSSYDSSVKSNTVSLNELKYLPDDAYPWGRIDEV